MYSRMAGSAVTYDENSKTLSNVAVGNTVIVTSTAPVVRNEAGDGLKIDTTKMEQTITVKDNENVLLSNREIVKNTGLTNINMSGSPDIDSTTLSKANFVESAKVVYTDDTSTKHNATITKVNTDGTYNIKYDDDTELDNVSADQLELPKSGGASRRQRSRKSARRHSVTKTRRQLRSTAKRLRRK